MTALRRSHVPPRLPLVAALLLACAVPAAPVAAQRDVPDPDDAAVTTASGATLVIGGFLQADGRVIAGDDRATGILLRRARLLVDATGERGFRFRLVPDFGQGRTLVQDAFVGWRGNGRDVQVGRFRPAFGTVRMRSSSTLLFPERGLMNALMPSRTHGGQLALTSARQALILGAFRSPLGAEAVTIDTDGDLVVPPPPTEELLLRVQGRLGDSDAGRGTRWQLSLLAGRAKGLRGDGTGPARLFTPGQRTWFAYDDDPADPVVADGGRWRASAGIEHVARVHAWHLELVGAEDGVRRSLGREAARHGGFGASYARVWRGTRAADYAITPANDRGAIEAGVRVGGVRADEVAWTRYAEPGSARSALSAGAALSWLPTRTTRLAASYDVTRLERARTRLEQAIIVRWQQTF